MAQKLAAGDLVEALPESSCPPLYEGGDHGTVFRLDVKDNGERRVLIAWARSGAISSVAEENWDARMKFVRKQQLEVGDLVRGLPGKDLSTEVEYYSAGDEATVVGVLDRGTQEEHLNMVWARTGKVSSVATANWMACVVLLTKQAERLSVGMYARVHGLQSARQLNGMLVSCRSYDAAKGRWLVSLQTGEEKSLKPENLVTGQGIDSLWPDDDTTSAAATGKELAMGDLVQVLPGNKMDGFYEENEEGTVLGCYKDETGEDRIRVVWARSGKTTAVRKSGWMTSIRFIRNQVLEVGDLVEALAGTETAHNGTDLYKPGDEATVEDIGTDTIRLLWSRSRTVTELPKASWMTSIRLARKQVGARMPGQAQEPPPVSAQTAGVQKETVKVQAPTRALQVGMQCRVQGLKGAAHRNGSLVSCQSFDSGKGRWLVHIVTDECVIRPIEMLVKPENLVPA